MRLLEQEINIGCEREGEGLIGYFEESVLKHLPDGEIPIRFVVTASEEGKYHCELGVLSGCEGFTGEKRRSIFKFNKRKHEKQDV